jgi:hypothetical protein
MPGLVPDIHVFLFDWENSWMAGTSPAMTIQLCCSDIELHAAIR